MYLKLVTKRLRYHFLFLTPSLHFTELEVTCRLPSSSSAVVLQPFVGIGLLQESIQILPIAWPGFLVSFSRAFTTIAFSQSEVVSLTPTPNPVSYTHLDVYKRQIVYSITMWMSYC